MERGFRLTFCCGCLLVAAGAQAPPEVRIRTAAWFPPDLVISANSNLVEMAATVRDPQGRTVAGLQASDFELLDNNRPREITVFSEQKSSAGAAWGRHPGTATENSATAGDHRSIALFFDDAHASLLGVRKSAEAAHELISNHLQPGDRVGIFTASGTPSVDFTDDRDLLLAALSRLQMHPLSGPRAASQCPTLTEFSAYLIVRHLDPDTEKGARLDAARCFCDPPPSMRCVEEQRSRVAGAAEIVWKQTEYRFTTTLDAIGIVIRHLAAEPGKRLFVILSPGFPTGGMEKQTSALVDAALRADIRISAVNSEGLKPGASLVGKMVRNEFMAGAAGSTGGRYLHDTNDWAGSLQTVTAVPEVSYLLGFAPPGDADGQYHVLKTRIRGNRDYRVESRPGYFAVPATGQWETVQRRIDRIAMSGETMKEFPVSLRPQQEGGTLHATIAVEASALRFPEQDGAHVQELTFLTVLEDAAGNFLAGKQSVMDMVLTPATLAEMQKRGIQAAVSFPVGQKGSYRIREVVREAAQNRVWAASLPVEIH